LIVGSVNRIPVQHAAQLAMVPAVIIGPRASESPFSAKVAIDTAVAGIHTGGTAVRMDDVPIPLRALFDGPPDATEVCRALRQRWTART
jgi:formylmethanofuran dehydrogenase subunit B